MIGVLPPPHPAGLCLGGGITKEQCPQCFPLKGHQRPKVAHTAEGGRGDHGEQYQEKADAKPPHPAQAGGNDQKDPIEAQGVRQLNAG